MSDIQQASSAVPTITRREDYRPPDWLVPEIGLRFDLDLEATRVQSTLQVARNGAHGRPLRLNGDGIAAAGVWVDGEKIDGWSMDGDDLVIPLDGDAHEIGIETRINPAANTRLSGLYASNGMLCTQCEAEGFRRI
ncbi:MAG TPA: aminopeptidase N, partial [Sphingomicrobium sp.]